VLTFLPVLALCAAAAAWAAPSEDRILPVDQYTSDKAKQLARTHSRALQELNADVYHCMPWLEVRKDGIGFYKPKHVQGDIRYLSLNVLIDQEPSLQFSKLGPRERAAAMFSRYVGPLLKRMTRSQALLGDQSLDGFTVILSWLKEIPKTSSERPVNETIAVFVPKSAAVEYVRNRMSVGQLADVAHVLAFDGETAKGQMKVTAWDDNFVSTYKVANYEVEKGVSCR
jgi:hypothetical protein